MRKVTKQTVEAFVRGDSSHCDNTSTDCRSDEGVTVGLIDAIITQCRVLKGRDFTTPAIQAALVDLYSDSDWTTLRDRAEDAFDARLISYPSSESDTSE